MPGSMRFSWQPVLEGRSVRLRPFREDDLDPLWDMLGDEEGRRLTGTHATFTREAAERWYRSRGRERDRLDLAIADCSTDRCVGEVVLYSLDADNRSCAFRISLVGPSVYDRGYGTEATRLILAHAFETVGIHRVELEVYDLNPRARHVYEKLGFVVEGVFRDALWWEGEFHDAIAMSMLAPEWAWRVGQELGARPGEDRPAPSRS
jgi:RimJ/RimL family protein N-acetyltransferase